MCEFCENEKIRKLKYSRDNPKNYIGKKFGKIRIDDCYWIKDRNRHRMIAEYTCECGSKKSSLIEHIKSGRVISCGCLKSEFYKSKNTKHNLYNDNKRLYGVWNTMIQRCTNKNADEYWNYGGRGIKVCGEWTGELGFKNFYDWAMSNGYDKNAERGKCIIDRIDVNGNYEPSNCRWVDMYVQVHNRRPYGTCKICAAGS